MRKSGFTHSEETKNKIRESLKGHPVSKDTRRKLKKYTGDLASSWKGGISFNKDYARWQKNRRNGPKRSAPGSHTYWEWETLKAQYNWTCPCCQKLEPEIKLTEDHIIPLIRGGSNNIENIQPLCFPCNAKKHDKTIKYE